MKIPMYHIRLTNALNKLGQASSEMEQAYFEDERNAYYKKLHEAAHRLYARFQKAYLKSCKLGRKEGWIQ